MRMRQKVCGKRYFIYARRNRDEKWTDWSQEDDIEKAMIHVENIRSLGFLAKMYNREEKEVVISDREKKVS